MKELKYYDESRVLQTANFHQESHFIGIVNQRPEEQQTVKWLMHARTRGIIGFYVTEVRRAAKSGLYAATVL